MPSERWNFLRDVLVFELKMLLDNVREFALIARTLGGASCDLVGRGEREGTLLHKVL